MSNPVQTRFASPIVTGSSHGRATPQPADQRFRQALRSGAGSLLSGVESVTGFIPGAPQVVAAVHGANPSGSASGSVQAASASLVDGTSTGDVSASDLNLGGAAAAGGGDFLAQSSNQQMQFIALQQRISDENRKYTTLSNVLKARHETAKNAISNIR